MKLDMKQKNDLLTGVKLATEIKSKSENLRKFITVFGYNYGLDNKYQSLEKVLKPNLEEEWFELRCYEIPKEYFENHWDISDDELVNDMIVTDIKGIAALEVELRKYIEDFSLLKPEWYCDNLL